MNFVPHFTRTITRTTTGERRRRWLLPLGLAAVLMIVAWWTLSTVEQSMKTDLTDELTTYLEADLAALDQWIEGQKAAVNVHAQDPRIVQAVAELRSADVDGDATAEQLLAAPAQQQLRTILAPTCEAYDYLGFVVVNVDSKFLAAMHDEMLAREVNPKRRGLVARILSGETVMSKPFMIAAGGVRDGGQHQMVPTMFVSAPLRNEKNKIIGLLAFEIRPEKDFTQILTVARFGTSGETYAFDDTGVMLSDSRFDDELRQIGLIGDAPDARALLNVSIRDPGVNMVDGETTDTARNEQPLTRMAAAAIAMKTRSQRREDGSRPIEIDVNGYRDYRGVPVIGVWTWLPEYGFGVTTEVDVAEAYRPLWVLRMAFGVLLGLLVISAGGIWFSSHLITLLQRRVRRAVSEAKQLGQYRLEQKIGEGGMGEVYRASHAMLRRPTAVKVLRAERSSKQAIGRFEREVQLTAALTHPNTIAIYDYGHTPEGEFYYAMEFLDGIPLDTLVKEYGPQSEARVIHILLQVCASLEEAHNASLIHRDVKPANIMLCARGGQHDVAKVLDFGLVKDVRDENDPDVSNPNALTGTPLYMSPEAIDDPQTVEARSDLYLVGCVGYYLLTGQHVFDGKTAVQIYFQHSQAKPVPPSERMDRGIDEVLEKVILCCLEKDREQRPADARALQEMLLKCHAAGHWNRDEAADWWKTHTERIVDQDTVISPRGIRSTEAATAIDVVNRNDTTQDWPGGETA